MIESYSEEEGEHGIDFDIHSDINEVIMDKNNGWFPKATHQLTIFLVKLRYHRVINNFYLSTLKKSEESMGWYLILLSTATSAFTVANNVEEEPFENYHTYVNGALTTISFATSLIGAWMKKKQFVERINNIDRYYQKLNTLCEAIEFELIKIPEDKMNYQSFKEKYHNKIKEYLVPNPLITPDQWKETVKVITKDYPELIDPDGSDENKLWPWYSLFKHRDRMSGKSRRMMTNYSDKILNKKKYINKDIENPEWNEEEFVSKRGNGCFMS